MIVPASWGVEQLEEKANNDCHEPGGKPAGGQFCSKTKKTSAPPSEPAAAEPTASLAPAKVFITDRSGDTSDLFGSYSAAAVARAMVSEVRGVDFSVTITSEGGESDDYYDSDNSEAYDQFVEEEVQSAAISAYDEAKREYIDARDDAYSFARNVFEEWKEEFGIEAPGDDKQPSFPGKDFNRITTSEGLEAFRQEVFSALDSVEEYIDTPDRDVARDRLRAVFDGSGYARQAEGPTGFPPFSGAAAISGHDYFNDRQGRRTWISQEFDEDTARESVDSYESWSDSQSDGHSGGPLKVNMVFTGTDGSHITRTFDNEDGAHVHHDLFSVNKHRSPPGLGKMVFRGSLDIYEKIGIDRVSVYAALDVGGYAWLRYGFAPDSLRAVTNIIRGKVHDAGAAGDKISYTEERRVIKAGKVTFEEQTFRRTLTTRDVKALQKVTGRGDDQLSREQIWGIIDSDLRADGGGSFKIGKWLMLGQAWTGKLNLHDEKQMQRTKTYISGKKKKRKTK